MTPTIKSVLAKKTGTINTKLESKHLNLGEVALIRFASENEFRAMLSLNHFIEHAGPPPVVIQGTQSTPDVAPQTIAPGAHTLTPPAAPVALAEVESHPCVNCRTMLILTTNTEGKQILFCANCNREELVEEIQKVEKPVEEAPEFDTKAEAEAEATKPKTVRSKCFCGKVKSKNALLCKSCATEQVQEDEAINNG